MSHSSSHFSERSQHHSHHPARAATQVRRPHGAPAPKVAAAKAAAPTTTPAQRSQNRSSAAHGAAGNGYTLAHAGKQVRFGPVMFWIVVGTVSLLGVWSAATATYFAFRDDVLTRLIARQAEMQYSYEDRIAELRARIDRTTSRQLLDQEQFEQKLEQIMRRQAALDKRTAALGGLPENGATGSIKPTARSLTDKLFGRNKPSPIDDGAATTHPQRQSWLNRKSIQTLDATISRLETSLDNVENRQNALLKSAEASFETRVRKMRSLIADLGLNAHRIEAAVPRSAVGGPYVPVKLGSDSDSFARDLYRVNVARAQADRLSHALNSVPYRKPVFGEIELSSGFGVRTDPFLGRPAMHTGLDFRASSGDPVRATAAGKVVSAGWAGGYGRMVEIDHGNGLATRYGHLSAIRVKVGDHVQIGQVVGAVGSTGRSTGPHLHYETRIDGDAVDPQRFLRAGARYAAN
jgi:murein DD-endopeptidase MepM/ murein hydrolase activator NlpD